MKTASYPHTHSPDLSPSKKTLKMGCGYVDNSLRRQEKEDISNESSRRTFLTSFDTPGIGRRTPGRFFGGRLPGRFYGGRSPIHGFVETGFVA